MSLSRSYMLELGPTSYEQQAKAALLSPGQNQVLHLRAMHLLNRCGATQDMGVLLRLASVNEKLYSYTALSVPPAANITTAIQAGTTSTIFSTTVNDGFIVQSTKPFNLVGFAVNQAQTGAPVYAYKYYNGASFAALPNIISSPDFSTTGDKLLVFPTPRLWVAGSPTGTGVSATINGIAAYTLLAQATTAPTQAVRANDLWLGKLIAFFSQVPDNQELSLVYEDAYPKVVDGLEAIMPYFGTADARNIVTAKYFSVG